MIMWRMEFLLLLLATFIIGLSTSTTAQSDKLIVPGKRIGPVKIGMYREDVISALGKPHNTVHSRGSMGIRDFYLYGKKQGHHVGLGVSYNSAPYTVDHLDVSNDTYATSEGIRSGSSIRDAIRIYGSGSQNCFSNVGTCWVSYHIGIEFGYEPKNNEIFEIDISAPR
jgi:hypothetical protein